MNIVCVICSDLLTPSDDVFYTPCGHIFHFSCLTQWLERSKTCPQCRERTTDARIRRIYFNFSNNDTIVEDPSSLQDQIDKLKFQILLREKDIKQYTEKNLTLEKQVAGMRQEVKKVEGELHAKNSAIHALKEQTKFFKQQCVEVDAIKQELARTRKKIEDLKNVQELLDASAGEVDEMMQRTRDPSTLVTYISVMKREMTVGTNKQRELRARVKSLQQELNKVSMERNFLLDERSKRKKLEEDLLALETENMCLQNRLRAIERQSPVIKHRPTSGSIKVDKRDVNVKKDAPEVTERIEASQAKEDEGPKHSSDTEDTENSPYLPIKAQAFTAFKARHDRRTEEAPKTSLSILVKKPRLFITPEKTAHKMNGMAYDGFGGHSKYDRFPKPMTSLKLKKPSNSTNKSKRPKFDLGDNQKIADLVDLS